MVRFKDSVRTRIDRLTGATFIDKETQTKFKSKKDKDILLIKLLMNGNYYRKDLENLNYDLMKNIKEFLVEEEKEQSLTQRDLTYITNSLQRELSTQPKEYTKTPLMISLGITNQCNMYCRHCGNNSSPYSKEMPPQKALFNIFDEIDSLRVMKLTLTGGEPTMRKDFEVILEKATSVVPRLGLSTNGSKSAHKYLDSIINYVGVVKVSIDGMEDVHDYIRGRKNSFKEAITFIQALNGKEVRIQSTLMKQNLESILEFILFANELHIKRLTIVPLAPIGRARRNDMISSQEYYEFITKAIERRQDINYELEIRPLFSLSGKLSNIKNIIGEKYKCEALITSIDILPDLSVIPCSFFHKKIGNLYSQTIREVWQSDKAREVRGLINYRPQCLNCEFYSTCGGGCIANAINGKDIYCWVRK